MLYEQPFGALDRQAAYSSGAVATSLAVLYLIQDIHP
jgi:hypothetical protein